MGLSYTKLFNSIIHSTIWEAEYHVKIVWVTMLAMADKDGVVFASIPGLARASNVTLEECEASLESFMAPDTYSRSQEYEGRRVEVVKGGWRLLNHEYYRRLMSREDQAEKNRERVRRHREKKRAETSGNADVMGSNACNDKQKQKQTQREDPEEDASVHARGQCPKVALLAAALRAHKRFQRIDAIVVAEDMVGVMGPAALDLTAAECKTIVVTAAAKAESDANESRLRTVLSWGCKDLEKNRRRARSDAQNDAGRVSEAEHERRKKAHADAVAKLKAKHGDNFEEEVYP
jgi:hypothetical protein